VTNRKAKTILWKYLVLYFYGGVFSDFGSIPKNFSADTIETDDDGIFVLQNSHDNFLSQSFIAGELY
jgi:mannosyltransferase OCH1-like enzyme